MTDLRAVPAPSASVPVPTSVGPVCECGDPACYPTRLPLDAWEVAGAAGACRGVDQTDLLAVAPGHLPEGLVVLEERDGWAIAGERRAA